MGTLFLTTVLSCGQVLTIANRLANISLLSTKQKTEILFELRKVVPSCPLIIHPNERPKSSS
jgi:hypothetical protein